MNDVSRRKFLKTAAGAVTGAVGAVIVAPVLRAGQLSEEDIIRAWKDEDFRRSLSDQQLAQLPEHPAGAISVEDTDDEPILRGPTQGGKKCGNTGFRKCTRSRDC